MFFFRGKAYIAMRVSGALRHYNYKVAGSDGFKWMYSMCTGTFCQLHANLTSIAFIRKGLMNLNSLPMRL